MTIEALRKKPVGVLEHRSFTFKYDGQEYEEHYVLGKRNSRYYIGFEEDGTVCSDIVSEEEMVNLLKDKEYSDREAMEIYMESPQLSCWMED